jgi:hypothetical protein
VDGLPLTPAAWLLLRATLLRAKALLTKDNVFPLNTTKRIDEFVVSIKGSKRYRKIFSKARENTNITEIRSVICFANLVNLPVPTKLETKKLLLSWNHSCCGNPLKEFIFKFRFNYLDLNNRINAFRPEIDPRCTFCRIRNPDSRVRDSLAHFFYDCPTSGNIVAETCQKFFPRITRRREFFWYGIADNTEGNQSINLLFWDTLRYVLYRFKKRRTVPNYGMAERELVFLLKTTIHTNGYFKEILMSDIFYAQILQALG